MNYKKLVPELFKQKYINIKKDQKIKKLKPKFNKITEDKFKKNNSPKIVMFATPNYGNLGDHAIAEAEKQFIQDNFPDYDYIEISLIHYEVDKDNIEKYINPSDLILIPGGGFLGSLWLEAEYEVRDILLRFKKNKVIIFPQTIYFENTEIGKKELKKSKETYESHPNLSVFLREQQSFTFFKDNFSDSIKSFLVPDIVTYLDYNKEFKQKEGVLFCLRDDKEKINHGDLISKVKQIIETRNKKISYTDTVINNVPNENDRMEYLKNKFDEFGYSELVVTDRLHGMIFALINSTPCIAMNNASGKVKGVYQWFKNVDFIECIDGDITVEELKPLIENLLTKNFMKYDKNQIIRDFEPLLSEIKDSI